MKSRRRHLDLGRTLTAAACLLAPGTLRAEDGQETGLAGEAALVSDYRYRGISYTAGVPALQGEVDLVSASGWSGGIWASAALGHAPGSGEIDLYAGRTGKLSGLDYTVTAYAYLQGDAGGVRYFELQGTLAQDIGPVGLQAEAALSPAQGGSPGNLYLSLTSRVPLHGPDLTLLFHGGYEDGFFRHKVDWAAGVEHRRGSLKLSALLVGSTAAREVDAPRTARHDRTALLASVTRSF